MHSKTFFFCECSLQLPLWRSLSCWYCIILIVVRVGPGTCAEHMCAAIFVCSGWSAANDFVCHAPAGDDGSPSPSAVENCLMPRCIQFSISPPAVRVPICFACPAMTHRSLKFSSSSLLLLLAMLLCLFAGLANSCCRCCLGESCTDLNCCPWCPSAVALDWRTISWRMKPVALCIHFWSK